MCSAEGSYMTAKTHDGTHVIIRWWDKGSDIPGCYTTVFELDGHVELSCVYVDAANLHGEPAEARRIRDEDVLTNMGVNVSTIQIVDLGDRANPAPT